MKDSSMPIQICSACGTSRPDTAEPPARCLICGDERQYVPPGGQAWTTPEKLASGHVNAWRHLETNLLEIHTHPQFGIGQRALLLRTSKGNILWDCIALRDDATEALVRGLGGLRAIAISHPHYYTCMEDWARTFDCPAHLHAADANWIMRADSMIRLWDGETLEIAQGVTLLRLGGHFPGGTVLHWAEGAGGRGAILSGDILQVAADLSRVSFLWSYPNMMPLAAATLRRIAATEAPWRVGRIFGALPRAAVVARGGIASVGTWRRLDVAAPHLAALAVMLQTETDFGSRTGFLLSWGILNFFWITLLRRPALSGALSLTLVVVLILLSRLKHDIVQMTANFVDLMVIDRDTAAFLFTIFPNLRWSVIGAAFVTIPLMYALWWLDPFRIRRLPALACLLACLAVLTGYAFEWPDEAWPGSYDDHYL